ncbi:MAG: hypothetical protein M1608_02220 [Candidatus Omnitrophica bacterium]|nr:hypothetical protein [Candidatus Omnitrophota bacterium]
MPSPIEFIVQFVLEKAVDEPFWRRAHIYRALATVVGDPKESEQLEKLAGELEAAEKRCRDFEQEFIKRTGAP